MNLFDERYMKVPGIHLSLYEVEKDNGINLVKQKKLFYNTGKQVEQIFTKMNLYVRPVIPFNPKTCQIIGDDLRQNKQNVHDLLKSGIKNFTSSFREFGKEAFKWTLTGLILICLHYCVFCAVFVPPAAICLPCIGCGWLVTTIGSLIVVI